MAQPLSREVELRNDCETVILQQISQCVFNISEVILIKNIVYHSQKCTIRTIVYS